MADSDPNPPELTQQDIQRESRRAYAAGYFDGEGTISIHRRRGKYEKATFVLQLNVGSTDPEPLYWLYENFGGRVRGPLRRPKENHKPIYFWQTATSSAESFLKEIYPYLIVKKKQADVALKLRATLGKMGERASEETIRQREELKAELSRLNRRGLSAEEVEKLKRRGESFSVAPPAYGKAFALLSPDGVIHRGINLKKFCQEHGLIPSNIYKVIEGERRHAHGWTRYEGPERD
jgi:hypothetical protein